MVIVRSQNRRPTGSDVARLAGVSKSAVSRVYTGGQVSEAARSKIIAAAAQLKFRPSHTARSLTTNRSHLIGIAVTYLDNQFYPEVVQKLSDCLAEGGYRIVLFITHGEDNLDPVLDEILSYGVDGVVFASSSRSAGVALECQNAGVPVVMFNSVDPQARVKSVAPANEIGARTAAAYLIAAGHTSFGLISGLEASTTSIERRVAFASEVARAGFEKPAIEPGHYTFDGAVQATRKLLSLAQPPDAIFCTNDHMAFAAIQTARSDFGRNIGHDLSIIGFDNVAIAGWPAFGLTTYEQPLGLMIDSIILYLTNAINGRAANNEPEIVEGALIVRTSARAALGCTVDDGGRMTWQVKAAEK